MFLIAGFNCICGMAGNRERVARAPARDGSVKVQIAKGVNEFGRCETADLCDHPREQRIGGDVEWHAEEKICAALVKLATQLAVLHTKLKQHVTRRQRHLLRSRRRFHALTIKRRLSGIRFDLLDHLVDLIDAHAIGVRPVAPLRAVNAAQVAPFIGPLVPNGHAVFVERADIRFAAQKPEQLVNNRFQMQLLRRQQGEGVPQIKPSLRAKNRNRPVPVRSPRCLPFSRTSRSSSWY